MGLSITRPFRASCVVALVLFIGLTVLVVLIVTWPLPVVVVVLWEIVWVALPPFGHVFLIPALSLGYSLSRGASLL